MSIISSNPVGSVLAGGLVGGAGLFHVSAAVPVRSELSSAKAPSKEVASIFSNTGKLEKRVPSEERMPRSSSYTMAQISCGERLGVEASECNIYGVYTNRNSDVAQKILEALNEDSWDDVTPEDLAGIDGLNLGDCGLESVTVEDLDGLTGLTGLNLTNNNLTEFTIPSFMPNLELLSVQSNQLTSLSGLEHLTNARTLYLSENQFTSITIPNNLTNMVTLSISHCNLTTLDIPSECSSLRRLSLENNQLESVILPATLTNLRSIDLRNNELTTLSLPPAPLIYYLGLNNNQLTSISGLEYLTSLNELDLEGNNFTSFSLPNTLVNLEFLSICRNNLVTLEIPQELNLLYHLKAEYNQLTSISLPSTLTRLRILLLGGNQFTDFTIQHALPALRHLNLGDNPLLVTVSAPWNEMRELSGFSVEGSRNLVITADLLNIPFVDSGYFWFDNNSELYINGHTYQWEDVKAVFGTAVSAYSEEADQLWPRFYFRFPDLEDLSYVQVSFLADLNELQPNSFPRVPVTAAQLACVERLNVTYDDCNRHGVFVNRNEILKESVLLALPVDSWSDVRPEMLRNFRDLRLANAGIQSLGPHDLDGFNCRLIYLQDNELSELPEGFLDGQTDLEYFYVFRNNLSEIPTGFFNNNPNLKAIYLQKNQLQALPESTFSNLNALEYLRLHNNQLGDLPSDFLSGSSDLTKLTLYGNGDLQLSATVFERLQAQNSDVSENCRVVYDRSNANSNLVVEISSGNTIPLADVVSFFSNGVSGGRNSYFYPNSLSEPDSTAMLTDSQRAFLCRFLENPSSSLNC